MKSMRRQDLERVLSEAGFVWVSNGPHIKWRCPITGLTVALTHDRNVAPGVLRTVLKTIQRSNDLINKVA